MKFDDPEMRRIINFWCCIGVSSIEGLGYINTSHENALTWHYTYLRVRETSIFIPLKMVLSL